MGEVEQVALCTQCVATDYTGAGHICIAAIACGLGHDIVQTCWYEVHSANMLEFVGHDRQQPAVCKQVLTCRAAACGVCMRCM